MATIDEFEWRWNISPLLAKRVSLTRKGKTNQAATLNTNSNISHILKYRYEH